jgi:hypothetical protein
MKVTADIRNYAANRERISRRWQVGRVSPLRAALALPTDGAHGVTRPTLRFLAQPGVRYRGSFAIADARRSSTTLSGNDRWVILISQFLVETCAGQLAGAMIRQPMGFPRLESTLLLLHLSKRGGPVEVEKVVFEILRVREPQEMTIRETPPPYGTKA